MSRALALCDRGCQHGTHVDISVACCPLRVPASWPYCSNARGRGGPAPKTRAGFSRVFRRWCTTAFTAST
eukprot:7144580-Prymnesium_polylepis.1